MGVYVANIKAPFAYHPRVDIVNFNSLIYLL